MWRPAVPMCDALAVLLLPFAGLGDFVRWLVRIGNRLIAPRSSNGHEQP